MKEFFSAYYYSFEATDCPEIDEILKEVASAGKGCHHTEDWNEYGYIEKIQAAANKAADRINAAQHPRALDVAYTCACEDTATPDALCPTCHTRATPRQ